MGQCVAMLPPNIIGTPTRITQWLHRKTDVIEQARLSRLRGGEGPGLLDFQDFLGCGWSGGWAGPRQDHSMFYVCNGK